MAEPQRAKIRVTGVVKRSSVPAAEAWSPAHRGSTASAAAVASAARVVNAQVNPQASPAKALNQSQPISEHSSSTSVATREPSPVTGEKATQEVRKRPISAQSRVVVCNLSKENKESKDAPVLQELKDKEKLKSENERLKMELSKALSPKEKKMLLAEKTNLLQVLQIEKDCLEKRCVALEKQLIVDAKIYEERLQQERDQRKQLEAEKELLNTRCQTLEKQLARRESEARKVGWADGQSLAVAVPENRPHTGNSMNSGLVSASNFSFESAASHASFIYCSSANSLRSVAEWVFPLQNRILPPEKTYDRQLLAPSDPRRQWLEEYINGSLMSHRKTYESEEWCSPPQIEIIRVSEVFNPTVNNAFYQQLSQMSEVWGSERMPVPELHRAIPIRTAWDQSRMNEVLLFHGCKWDSLFGILREGFDPRLGGVNTGAAFGIGCYFTTVASKADAYTERWDEWEGRPNCEIPSELRCLLVARVALGEVFEMFEADSSLRRPPVGPNEVRCDSVLGVPRQRGGVVDYDEFVIYKQAQAAPQFIVDYKHTECCTCRSCMADSP